MTINGGPAPGVSSGTAIAAMEELSRSTLPAGYSYEWTGTAYQEQAASGWTGGICILGLAVLFAYLFLVALYGGLGSCTGVAVAVGVFGSYLAIKVAGLNLCLRTDRSRGVDRARRQERHPHQWKFSEQREAGMSITETYAMTGSQMRFRAVMMTSVAFILDAIPLVAATGAAEISRKPVGTSAVFGGMLAASSIISLVPMLYVAFQRWQGSGEEALRREERVTHSSTQPRPE